MKLLLLILATLVFGFHFETAKGQERFGIDIVEADPGMDKVEIYLHTVNIGNKIYDNFGHTAIRVVDKRTYTDLVYNWGMFDFGNPLSFSLDFYRGDLNYKLGVYSMDTALRVYQSDTRSVWEDRLILTPLEKKRLLTRLQWNRRPENLYYSYQYFFDNCATRPRDYLDEALGGVLKSRYEIVTSPMTFRDFVMEAYQYTPGMDVLLDFGMNSRIDRFATMWETMFHPLHLRSVLKDYSEKQKPLLTDSRIIFQHESPAAYPRLAYSFILLFGGVPLIPLGFWLFIQQNRLRPSKLLYRAFGGLSSLWLFCAGFFGLLMTFSWYVSGHLDLHHNANQLLFWPTDFILFMVAFAIFLKGKPLDLSPRLYSSLQVYLVLHLLLSLSLPVLKATGHIEQNISRAAIFLLPPFATILLLLFRVGIRNQSLYQVRKARPDEGP